MDHYPVLVLLILTFGNTTCVLIRQTPENATALAGNDAIFRCEILENVATDYIFWKKVSMENFTDVISYNFNVLNASKYSIDSEFTLTVRDVTVADEAWYECQADIDRERAFLTVTVSMANMTLRWGVDPPFPKDSVVNLTCIVARSRPPAQIRWFHGQNDVTVLASSCSIVYAVDGMFVLAGYGDTTSVINVAVTDDANPFRCVASVPGTSIRETAVTYPIVYPTTSSASMAYISKQTILLFTLNVMFLKVFVIKN